MTSPIIMELSAQFLRCSSLEAVIERNVLRVSPQTSVAAVVNQIHQTQVADCALVVDRERLLGLFNIRQLMTLIATNQNLEDTLIKTVMNADPISLNWSESPNIFTLLSVFRQYHLDYLPVVNQENQPLGVIGAQQIFQSLEPAPQFYLHQHWLTSTVAQMQEALTIEQVLQTTVNQLQLLLKVDYCLIFTSNSKTLLQAQYIQEASSQPQRLRGRSCAFLDSYHQTLAQGQPIIISQIDEHCPQELQTYFQNEDIQKILIVPIFCQHNYWGGICLYHKDSLSPWHEEGIALAIAIATHCGIAIDRVKLHQQAQSALEKRRMTETELSQSEVRFGKVFEASPVPISIMSLADQCFLTVNESFLTSFEYQLGEVVNQTGEQLNLWNNPEHHNFMMEQLARQQMVRNFKTQFRTKNNKIRHVFISAILIKLGGESCVLSIINDITEHQEVLETLQQTKDQLQVIIDTIPGFVSWINAQGNYVGVNDNLAQALNQSPEIFIGQELGFLQASSDFVDFIDQFLKSNKQNATQIIASFIEGKKKYYLIAVQKFHQGNDTVSIGIDVTQQVEAQKALEQAKDNLGTIVDHRTAALKESNHQLRLEISEHKQTEIKLRQTNEQLQAVLDAVPGMISWIDFNCRYIGVNRHLASILALPPEAFIGKSTDIFEINPEFTRSIRQFLPSKNQSISQEITAEINGKKQNYLVVSQKYKQGKAVVSVGINITELKKTERQLRAVTSRFSALIENLQAGVLVQDEHGQVVLINQSFCDIFHIPIIPAAVIGANFATFSEQHQFFFSDPQQFLTRYQEILNAQEIVTDEEIEFKDGRFFERDYVPIFVQNRYCGNLWMYRDITERKKLEAELRQTLTKEKELNELKSRFISMTSHEFRTPLTTIFSSSELLEHYRHKWSDEKQISYLQRIQKSVQHMTQMLDDILIIGKADAGRLNINPIPIQINQFCQELIKDIKLSKDSQHKIIYKSSNEESQEGIDEKLLRHILVNLLSNAVKYSPKDSLIEFSATCQKKQIIFQVKDQGFGIPLEEQPLLFDSFHRGSNVGNIPGTGLGLTIVKKCVDVYGGSIKFQSEVNQGTIFTVVIPRN